MKSYACTYIKIFNTSTLVPNSTSIQFEFSCSLSPINPSLIVGLSKYVFLNSTDYNFRIKYIHLLYANEYYLIHEYQQKGIIHSFPVIKKIVINT